jgi:hypothetical protein
MAETYRDVNMFPERSVQIFQGTPVGAGIVI